MNKDESYKLPRLYSEYPLSDKVVIPLKQGQAHYLHTVMRRKDGDHIRLFDGTHGEWLGVLEDLGKKNGNVRLEEQLATQPDTSRKIHLLFTPIKKHRMDWLIEKAVELGVTDFHPIVTQNTEVRKVNEERLRQQIFEAAEQCERFEIPIFRRLKKMEEVVTEFDNKTKILSCLERYDTQRIGDVAVDSRVAVLIGPEGGFTSDEKEMLACQTIPVSLGDTVLRCETAVAKALILINP